MKTLNDVVVERLNYYMGKQNITQYRLAELSDLPYATIKSIMQRRTKGISLKTIIMVSNGLNIKPAEFISGNEFLAENLDLE